MEKHIPDEVLDFMADRFRMLFDPTRLLILRTLMEQGERNVGQVVEATGGTQGNILKHLKLLSEAGLLDRRKEGLNVLYRLDDPVVEKICHLVCETILKDFETQSRRSRILLK